jgi:hypothetical protein
MGLSGVINNIVACQIWQGLYTHDIVVNPGFNIGQGHDFG